MATKTLQELRALARSRGIKEYSAMSWADLERRLTAGAKQKPGSSKKKTQKKNVSRTRAVKAGAKAARARGKKKPTPAAAAKRAMISPAQPPEWTAEVPHVSTEEERVESAKYATVLPGGHAPPAVAADLGEDIAPLPTAAEPMLCLLPQKPGILHGYWAVPPGTVRYPRALKLRLGRVAGDRFEILEEIPLPHERGHWYFHLDESADHGAIYLQVGYYEPGGRFVSAIRRSIARIPSLYASDRTDRLWWVSEEQFRAMYLRAGGFVRGARLGWAASIGSPGGRPAKIPERLLWPGGVSSQ